MPQLIGRVDTQLAQTAPAWSALVTVPTTTATRYVFGTWRLAGTSAKPALIYAQVETGVGTNTYRTVVSRDIPLGDTVERSVPFFFPVPGGCRYRFLKTGNSLVTESIDHYSYVDV